MDYDERYLTAEKGYWDLVGVRPREEVHHLATTGGRVRVQVVGDGPPVLFLHGANTCGTVWAPLAARLSGYRCLLLDRPGCGLSEPLGSPVTDIAAFAAFADGLSADVLDALGVDRAHIVATSLGGYHALRTAAARPDRVAGVALMGWSVGAPNGYLPLVMRLGGARRLGRVMARLPVPRSAVRPMLARIGLRQALEAGQVTDEMVTWFHALLRYTNTMRNELDGSPAVIHPLRGMNESILLPDDVLGRIQSPTCFLWGEADPFGGTDVARAFTRKVPGAELTVFPDAGHAVWVDDVDRTASATADFLARSGGRQQQ